MSPRDDGITAPPHAPPATHRCAIVSSRGRRICTRGGGRREGGQRRQGGALPRTNDENWARPFRAPPVKITPPRRRAVFPGSHPEQGADGRHVRSAPGSPQKSHRPGRRPGRALVPERSPPHVGNPKSIRTSRGGRAGEAGVGHAEGHRVCSLRSGRRKRVPAPAGGVAGWVAGPHAGRHGAGWPPRDQAGAAKLNMFKHAAVGNRSAVNLRGPSRVALPPRNA